MVSYILRVSSIVLVVGVGVSLASLAPRHGEQVAVVFAPWVDAETAVHRVWEVGGDVLSVRGGAVVAQAASNDFFTRLRDTGAVLILDAQRVAALCGPSRAS